MIMKKILIAVILVLSVLMIPHPAIATTFDLIAPSSDQLVRGQDVKFTVNVDTGGQSLTSTSIGMTYEAQYLEYVSTIPGNTFKTVSTDVQGSGKLIISGSSTTPFSSSGTYAYVTFKLIAAGPGSTQLCALFNPSTAPPVPTSPPAPTSLPNSGDSKSASQGIVIATFFLIMAAGGFFVLKKT